MKTERIELWEIDSLGLFLVGRAVFHREHLCCLMIPWNNDFKTYFLRSSNFLVHICILLGLISMLVLCLEEKTPFSYFKV